MFKRHTFQRFIDAVCFLCLCPVAFAQQFPWWMPAPSSWALTPKSPHWPPAPIIPTISAPIIPSRTVTLSRTGKADHELMVWGHGTLNPTDCSPLEPPPAIDLEAPPGHGILCLRPANYLIGNTFGEADYCLGKKTSGVYVIYLPRHGYTGADTLRYTARPPRGRITVNANLTIVPDTPPSPGPVPADISAPGNDTPQSLGPIPACTALVS